jgi:hypothetical protein
MLTEIVGEFKKKKKKKRNRFEYGMMVRVQKLER